MKQRWIDTPAVVFAALFPTVLTATYFVGLRDAPSAVQQAVYLIGKIIQFGFPVMVVFAIRRKKLKLSKPAVSGLWVGVGFGLLTAFAMFGLYILVLRGSDFLTAPEVSIQKKVTGLGIDSVWKYACLGVFYSLVHSLLEEYYWRWFVFRELIPITSLKLAIAISSVGFMSHHVILLAQFFGWGSPATWLFSLAVAVGGGVWAAIYDRSKSIYAPWCSHLIVDAAIFVIGFDLVKATLVP